MAFGYQLYKDRHKKIVIEIINTSDCILYALNIYIALVSHFNGFKLDHHTNIYNLFEWQAK